jgi:Recombinase
MSATSLREAPLDGRVHQAGPADARPEYILAAPGEAESPWLADDPDDPSRQRPGKLRRHGKSLRQIADALHSEGYRPKGSRWYASTVRRMLAA